MSDATFPEASRRGEVRIGVSGWSYGEWRGAYYPAGLKPREELAFTSRRVSTIEINASFYALQRPSSYMRWHDETPDGFVFSVKGPRQITHLQKLANVRTPLSNFLASGLLALRAKLGPVLWQFPPGLRFDADRVDAFLGLLPHDTEAALALAHEHDATLAGPTGLQIDRKRVMRHAVEVRHASFADPAFIELLRRHRVALVVAETAGRWPLIEDVTADFVYLRLHGDQVLYSSEYGETAIADWARRIAAWRDGGQVDDARVTSSVPPPHPGRRDVFCYFDNSMKAHAPHDAARLAGRLAPPG